MTSLEMWELLSYIVTVTGLPLAIAVFIYEQRRECRRMKLNIFGVCDSRSGAMSHREPVSARADRICRVSIDPSKAARSKYRRAREVTMHRLFSAIEDVTTMTRHFAVVV